MSFHRFLELCVTNGNTAWLKTTYRSVFNQSERVVYVVYFMRESIMTHAMMGYIFHPYVNIYNIRAYTVEP